MPEPSSIGPIRPGYIERGVLYARKAAYADGYRVGRAGGPIPHRRDVYPYAKRWITGYIDGELDRREYDDAHKEAGDARGGRGEDPPVATVDVVGHGGSGGGRIGAGLSNHGRGEVGRSGRGRSRAARQVPLPARQAVA